MCIIELIVASCVCGYHVYGENWIVALEEELYCEQDITMQSAAAMAHNGIKLESVPLGLGKVLLCGHHTITSTTIRTK